MKKARGRLSAQLAKSSAPRIVAVPRDIARKLPERLQELLGYNIYPPFVGYVDGSHPRGVLSAGSGTHRQGGNPKLVAPPSSTSGCTLT
jgi:ectoine hydroxylase-related dioxygenase (phytanoyl-CoA dioxygenase family)